VTALAALCVLTASACGQAPRGAGGELAPPRTVRVTRADAGRTVRLSVGQVLVVEAPGTGGAARWVVARYPRKVLERRGRPPEGDHVFGATSEGRGDVLLVNLAAWPGGPCEPRPTGRRCLLPLNEPLPAASARVGLRILEFEVVVG
jgi:hypothetical protein